MRSVKEVRKMLVRQDVREFIDLVLNLTPSQVPTPEVERPLESILEPSMPTLVVCAPCKGTGRIMGAICMYCAGAGSVRND